MFRHLLYDAGSDVLVHINAFSGDAKLSHLCRRARELLQYQNLRFRGNLKDLPELWARALPLIPFARSIALEVDPFRCFGLLLPSNFHPMFTQFFAALGTLQTVPALESLRIEFPLELRVADMDLDLLAALPMPQTLRRFSLRLRGNVTAASFASISSTCWFKNLEQVVLMLCLDEGIEVLSLAAELQSCANLRQSYLQLGPGPKPVWKPGLGSPPPRNVPTVDLVTVAQLPGTLGFAIPTVRRLCLAQNELTAVPESIGQFVGLRDLQIGGNKLERLPEALWMLVGLWYLDLSENCLTELSPGIGKLTHLRSLNLLANRLTGLPDTLQELTALQHLNLSHNEWTCLPEPIRHLHRLQTLHMDLYKVGTREHPDVRPTIPTSAPLRELTNLQWLTLRGVGMTDVSTTVLQLSALHTLDLSGTRLRRVPDTIGQLVNLRVLLLRLNELTTLPCCLWNLRLLESLDVSRNDVMHIPDGIEMLASLVQLDLSYNRLEALPAGLQHLQCLERLDLEGNFIIPRYEDFPHQPHLLVDECPVPDLPGGPRPSYRGFMPLERDPL